MTAPRPTPKVVEQTTCQFAGRESNNKIVDRVLFCGAKGLVAPRYRDLCQMRTSMSSKWEHGGVPNGTMCDRVPSGSGANMKAMACRRDWGVWAALVMSILVPMVPAL
jgi:hypothetical protein